MFTAIAALALLQQTPSPQPPPAPPLVPSPVARIVVTPSNPIVQAGDTIQLKAEAFDANGARLAHPLRFGPASDPSRAAIDSTGRIVGANVGKAVVSVMAAVPGAKP